MTISPVPFDRDLVAALDGMPAPAALTLDSIELARERVAALAPSVESILQGRGVELIDRTIPGPEGAPDLPIAIFRRRGARARPCAGVFWIHGGAYFAGDRFLAVDEYVRLVDSHEVVVVSPEYRLAPEHPHPAPIEDCYAGLVWFAAHADELGVDPARLLVAGGSAGGGLAAALALMARDRGGPALVGQMLSTPMLDDRQETVSSQQYSGRDDSNGSTDLVSGWDLLLGPNTGRNGISPYAAPARAIDVSALPPAFIDVGSAESYRDEAVEYASRLWAAGVQAELHVWPGGYHGFWMFAPRHPLSISAVSTRLGWIQRTLNL